MFLESVKLHNIRSYKNETISFEKGINLLWGNVGCGKTTILQAIEFALFGLGNKEGKFLLRNGTKTGSVTLLLSDNFNTLKIKRTLELSKLGIRQKEIVINSNNKILTLSPQEANEFIIKYLKIPKNKGQKNLTYRYIIYTPQEELKKILEEKEDIRLEVIRKAFHIDKYKILENALKIYLSEKKIEKGKLEVYFKELDNLKKEIKDLKEKKKEEKELLEQKEKDYDKHLNSIESLKLMLDNLNKERDNIKDRQRDVSFKLKEINNVRKEIDELNRDLIELNKKNDKTLKGVNYKELLKKFETIENKYLLKKDIKYKLEMIKKEKEDLEKRRLELENKLSYFKDVINGLKPEIDKFNEKEIREKIKGIEEKKREIKVLKDRNQTLNEDLSKLNLSLNEKVNLIKSNTIKLKEVSELNNCPTCLQKVDIAHKKLIKEKIEQENKKLETEKEKLLKKISDLEKEKNENEKIINQELILEKELLDLRTKEETYKNKVRELDKLFKNIDKVNEEISKINEKLNDNKFKKIEELNDIDAISKEYYSLKLKVDIIENNFKRIRDIETKISTKKKLLEKEKHLNKEYKRLESILDELTEKDKSVNNKLNKLEQETKTIYNKIADLRASILNIDKDFKRLNENLKKAKDAHLRYNIILKTENWITNDLFYLLNKFEKFLFKKYYTTFTEQFELIFRELIEETNIDVRLNDAFSPIIEQNGYETTFENLSGGERSSISFAYRIALAKVIEQNLPESMKLNFIILDEPTDGFSYTQINKISYLLNKFNFKQSLIVSHDEKLKSHVDNLIELEKINHISRVVRN